jgi:ABC-2 type transport system permease protein
VTTDPKAAQSATQALPNFIDTTLLGMQLSILLVAVLSAVAGASDFGNGTIRAAFAAAPRRTPVLAAKLTVIAGITTVLVSATLLLTAVVTWLALTPGPLWTPATSSTSLLSLAGAVIATAAVSVSAVSLGCILRSSGRAISAILGLLIVVSIAMMAIPPQILAPDFSRYVFGEAVTILLGTADSIGKWIGAVVALVAWSAAFTAWASASMRRRDV